MLEWDMHNESAPDHQDAGPAHLLEATGLTVRIAGKSVCRDLDLVVRSGECWGVLGTNGVGKTTLMLTLAGLRAPESGRIRLEGRSLTDLSRRRIAQRLGVLFQEQHAIFPGTVLETALTGRHPYLRAWEWEGEDDITTARHALQVMELAGLGARPVTTLSGGEQRRLALATLLTQDPRLYLLDEPTNHLDLRHQVAALELFRRRVRERGKAMVVITHDVNLAARYCTHLLLLFGAGETLQGGPGEVLTEEHLQRVYGHPVVRIQTPSATAYLPR